MRLADKIRDPSTPVTFFEVVPPPADKPASLDSILAELQNLRGRVDAINLPEIHDESRSAPRNGRFVPRLEPRVLGERIWRELETEVVVNRCVAYEADPVPWFRETAADLGISNAVLVGGESSKIQYPGLGVVEAARQLRSAGIAGCLGGITIPSRLHEAERIRQKAAAGLEFFTTQVLFDPNDIVWLIQKLNGLEARIFLSFAPVGQARDLEFLRWLGADIPPDLDRFLMLGRRPEAGNEAAEPDGSEGAGASSFERSLDLAQRILMEVFDNLPPDPPPLGLNIEHINRRNFAPALKMLDRLGDLYGNLVMARARV
ncbi:MAG TPA: hypothetical protein VGW33_15650 [Terriglobia bacterium]|nr:hypothetical protein [Terriglobia bacterium]